MAPLRHQEDKVAPCCFAIEQSSTAMNHLLQFGAHPVNPNDSCLSCSHLWMSEILSSAVVRDGPVAFRRYHDHGYC